MTPTQKFSADSSAISAVVVVPRSGYINRLQAMASSSIMARELDADFSVCWESQSVVSASAEALFSPRLIDNHFMSSADFLSKFGYPCSEVPRYFNESSGVISLAGFEFGEQYFMDELKSRILQLTSPHILVISAGGNFSLDTPEQAVKTRGAWYRDLVFADQIEKPSTEVVRKHEPYLGVHLRFTDRSRETPLGKEIESAVLKQVEQMELTSIFIASDSRAQRDKLASKLAKVGLNPWFIDPESLDRTTEKAGIAALVDWRILGQASSSVYFAASSFGHEAAVMAGTTTSSVALPGHPVRRWQARGQELVSALINYPSNHWSR